MRCSRLVLLVAALSSCSKKSEVIVPDYPNGAPQTEPAPWPTYTPPAPTPRPTPSPTPTPPAPKPKPGVPKLTLKILSELPLIPNTVKPVQARFVGNFRNTWYRLTELADYPGPRTNAIRKIDGSTIAMVSTGFRRDVDIQGSGKLDDGRVINFASVLRGEIRYTVTVHPWGRGVGNCALKPFRSLAVDPNEIPFGSVVYLPDTVWMQTPEGKPHDGFWYTSDAGGAIKGDRIDIFVGRSRDSRFLTDARIHHLEALPIYLVALPNGMSCTKQVAR